MKSEDVSLIVFTAMFLTVFVSYMFSKMNRAKTFQIETTVNNRFEEVDIVIPVKLTVLGKTIKFFMTRSNVFVDLEDLKTNRKVLVDQFLLRVEDIFANGNEDDSSTVFIATPVSFVSIEDFKDFMYDLKGCGWREWNLIRPTHSCGDKFRTLKDDFFGMTIYSWEDVVSKNNFSNLAGFFENILYFSDSLEIGLCNVSCDPNGPFISIPVSRLDFISKIVDQEDNIESKRNLAKTQLMEWARERQAIQDAGRLVTHTFIDAYKEPDPEPALYVDPYHLPSVSIPGGYEQTLKAPSNKKAKDVSGATEAAQVKKLVPQRRQRKA